MYPEITNMHANNGKQSVVRRCVAFVLENADSTGAVTDITRRQAMALIDRNLKVLVVTRYDSDKWPGVHYINMPSTDNAIWTAVDYGINGFSLRLPFRYRPHDLKRCIRRYRFGFIAAQALKSYGRDHRIDACLACEDYAAIGLLQNEFTMKLPLIFSWHADIFEYPKGSLGPLVTRLSRYASRLTYRRARHSIVVSTSLRERAISCGADPAAVSLIPSGISLAEITGALSVGHQLRSADTEIIFVGRLSKEKDVATLLKAVAVAGLPSYRLRIAGDGPEWKALISLASELNISIHVEFMGIVERRKLAALYKSADLFILPSLSDAQPRVLLEAMLCGVPVIATDVGGVKDIVQDAENGLLVAKGDVNAMAFTIKRLAGDPSLRKALASAGKKKAAQYDWPSILDRFYRVVKQTLE